MLLSEEIGDLDDWLLSSLEILGTDQDGRRAAAKVCGLDRETMHYIDSIIAWYLQNKERGIVVGKREKEPEC